MCEKLCAEHSESDKAWSLPTLPLWLNGRHTSVMVYYGKCCQKNRMRGAQRKPIKIRLRHQRKASQEGDTQEEHLLLLFQKLV